MTSFLLSISKRTKVTPYHSKVVTAGVKAFTVYNHTLLPTVFESLEADYWHLKNHVQLWDVSCQRQIEIIGQDAAKLVQKLTPRLLSKMPVGSCYYAPLVNDEGKIINDPVILKLASNRFWLSIADSDILLWVQGLKIGFGFNVQVQELDVFPLAIQGPKAEELMSRVFGEQIRSIKFFRFMELPFESTKQIIARSGWSKQGGFEIYLNNANLANSLWEQLSKAGADLNVRAGCPNLIERIEGGLLSYGNDITSEDNPYECGFGHLCHPEGIAQCIGARALQKYAKDSLNRSLKGILIKGNPLQTSASSFGSF